MANAPDWRDLVPGLEALIRQAGTAIMAIYDSGEALKVETKPDDSPLTQADRAAHQILCRGLAELTPERPVLSEETVLPAFAERAGWHSYWLVDPLDGTKEFIGRTGEFTVNLALIEAGEPVLGLVYVPVQQRLYLGGRGMGAWRVDQEGRRRIQARAVSPASELVVVASRRHGGESLEPLLAEARRRFAGVQLANVGSALKICLVAEGEADWYPRLGPTSEWDTAAAQAVLVEAGGALLDDRLQLLRYNSKESLLNPDFHAVGDPSFDWCQLLCQ